jgi:hypothetical protein
MQYTLRYSHTKHGRIKISSQGELILSIPYSQAKNEIFKQKMRQKAHFFTRYKLTLYELVIFHEYVQLYQTSHEGSKV